MNKTNIAWTDESWNPVTGCTPISEGCANCYAEPTANRLHTMGKIKYKNKFNVTLHPGCLDEPLRRKKPTKIFVCSMSDLFHDDVPAHFIHDVFATMGAAKQHTFQILTKRPKRMHELLTGDYFTNKFLDDYQLKTTWPLPNVWLGVTVENQKNDWRLKYLLDTPAAKRFVSIEPILEEIVIIFYLSHEETGTRCSSPHNNPIPDLRWVKKRHGVDWVIVGGESGPKARECQEEWIRSIYDQCQSAQVPFFFKQCGQKWKPSEKMNSLSEFIWMERREWPK